jgi:DnaD/phage-associated family protein
VTIKRFAGFPDRMAYIPVPGAILGTLLGEIDDLAEFKALLHIIRLLHEQRRAPRFVRRSELLADAGLLLALTAGHDDSNPDEAIRRALDRSLARGTLLAAAVTDGTVEDACLFLNTSSNERLIRDLATGVAALGDLMPAVAPREADQSDERTTIYALYEQNIGLLTPLLADELHDAEEAYPTAWIEDAFREAVAQNKRNWRYVLRILESWASRGRGTSGTNWRRAGPPAPPEDPRKYFEGEFGRLVRR